MRLFYTINYTVPPLRKNFKAVIVAGSEEDAIKQLLINTPTAKVMSVSV